MTNSTFNPTSSGSQRFLLKLLKHIDTKTRRVDLEALAEEEGVTVSYVLKKLNGIKAALVESLDGEKTGEEQPSGSTDFMQKKISKRKGSTTASASKAKKSKLKQEIGDSVEEKDIQAD
ncbi:hypothetical protein TWF694_010476 [Orbilia ellipsospora]|uniref:Uncharacterized protein n=1 Tax=Orbilia ellipsospora TaxID=2528407 RepID=A0AAV9XA16_9PEZI